MIEVKTNIDHNIQENVKKELLSTTATLISYLGNEYISKLTELNNNYNITNRKTIKSITSI